ncbi:retrovirus-related pol polyprotein from transposon TNT 1-94 [Tanacetum coccineum]
MESSTKTLVDKLKGEIEDFKTKNKSLESSNNHFKKATTELAKTNQLLFKDLKKFQVELDRYHDVHYASKVKIDCAKAKGDLMSYKIESQKSFNEYTGKINDLNQTISEMKRELIAHQETIFIMSQEKETQNKFHKTPQLQDKDIAISELKKLIEKIKGKSVETKIEKPSVIRQPNAFKSQRQSILGKPTTFSDSLAKKEFSKSKSVTKNDVSKNFSKPVTTQILPQNVKSILKNTNVIAPGMYKVHTKPNQTRTPQLPQDIRKTNKHVSFTTGVISTTSVSRPQLKSNRLEDRVMHNNSQGKKQQVEDQRRNFKFSNNKMSVTACNDSLNAKTSNAKIFSVTCGKCVLNDNHDMCVLHYINGMSTRTKQPIVVPISTREPKRTVNQSVATPLKKTIASKSANQKPRSTTRKQYEHVSKTCKWWYSKITPPGYKWKPKTSTVNVKPDLEEIILFIVNFGALKAHDGKSQASNYGDLIQGNVTIKRVYYVKWLNHNLFSVGQLCDSDLEVAFRKSTCYICDLKGNDLLTGKAKRKSFKTKTTPSSKRRLKILHMDLCGPMRVESINGKKYVLVIVDDYSRYMWTHFLRSKDETPEVLIDFLKLVQRALYAQVRTVQINKGTKFLNKTLHAYFAQEGIEHQMSTARTPEQNGVVERRNHTLVEAAQTMLSAAKVPLFFSAEAIATACFTQNRSLSRAYRVYNKITRVIVETIHVNFDELPLMALDHVSSDAVPQSETVTTLNELDLLFSLMFDELLNGTTSVVSKSSAVTAADAPNQRQQQNTTPSTSTTVVADTPPLNIQTTPVTTSQAPTVTATENNNQAETQKENAQVDEDEFINIFSTPVQERGETSSRYIDSSNMHTFYQRNPSEHHWTRDHPLE